MTQLKRTPLFDLQQQAGGRMVPFAGFEMAVQFQGVVAEHRAVRAKAGLFDVSHMGEVVIEGVEALDAVQYLITNDAGKLTPGKALYTVMCVENGGIVDDLIVYCESPERYFLCINASRREADVAHITEVCEGFGCDVQDVSDDYAQLALQGPEARAVLQKLTPHGVGDMGPFTWADVTVADLAGVRVARTGYTGEHGYELYCTPAQAPALWRALSDVGGAEHGLVPCGLGARDTLRLEMKYPLYGNDIDLQTHPIEAGLGWVVKFKKPDYVGRSVLEALKKEGPTRKWVGFRMLGRGIPRQGYLLRRQGENVGVVTSGTHSPSLGEAIGAGYVSANLAAVGTELDVVIRDKPVRAVVAQTPFYQPK